MSDVTVLPRSPNRAQMIRCPKEHSPAVFFGRLYDKDTAIATMLPILKALRQSTDLLFEDINIQSDRWMDI